MDFVIQFAQCESLDLARDLYRSLSKRYHPDLGGDVELMKAVNAAYEGFQTRRCTAEERETEGAVMAKILEVLLMDLPEDCVVELVGSWIWVTGNTKEHRERLKGAGLRWSGTRKRWYWHEGTARRRRACKGDFEDVKARHGSKAFAAKRGALRR